MKNPKDFTKLFDLNVPVMEHFEYYINQLSKTEKFKDIKYLLTLFEEADVNIDNIYEYRMNKSNDVIEFIKSTNAYNELCYDNTLIDFPTNKSFQYEEGVNYFSVDLRSANWVSLKKYDQLNELGDSYSELLKKFEMPDVFIHSKYLRQLIFGNVNPKKQQRVQRSIMQEEIIRKYSNDFSVECVRSDEVIFKFDKFEEMSKILDSIDNKFRCKIFTVNRVEDFRINNIYDRNGNILNREMVGVSGNQFFMKLKQYITGEKLDIKDLYFKNDGKLAVWHTDELEFKLV